MYLINTGFLSHFLLTNYYVESCGTNICNKLNHIFFQRKYILKFSTDGAQLNNNQTAVQATVKLIDVDEEGKPLTESALPEYLQREICVYYFIGNKTNISFIPLTACILIIAI